MLVLRTAAPSGRSQIADTGEEHAVQRFFLACEDRLIEHLRAHPARARKHADPVLPPRLHGHDDVLSRLRRTPEVVEQAPQRLAVRPARAERVCAMLLDDRLVDQGFQLPTELVVEALIVVEGLVGGGGAHFGRGRSSAGLRAKKLTGRSSNSCHEVGKTGQSSGRTTWWKPSVYQSTMSRSSIRRSWLVHCGRPAPPFAWFG